MLFALASAGGGNVRETMKVGEKHIRVEEMCLELNRRGRARSAVLSSQR
jgi:hypothetical protein